MSLPNTTNSRNQLSFASRIMAPSQSTMSLHKFLAGRRSKDEASQKLKKGGDPVLSKDWTREPISAALRLDTDVLNRLPREVLERLPPEGLKRLELAVLVTLSPEALSRLPTEDMRRLPAEKIGTLPPKTLARLAKPAPGVLSILNAEQLGQLLPELEIDDLNTMPRDALSNISNVDPLHLVRIPEQGLILLVQRNPELYKSLQSLPNDLFLRLPHSILDKIPFDRFQKIPAEVWEAQPDQVWLNLPPDIKRALREGGWDRPSVQSEMPSPASSMEPELRSYPPITPSFPVEVSPDGIFPPKAKATKPPLSRGNHSNSPLRRNNSFSAPRSQASNSSQDFRAPAIRYPEGGPGAPERRGSRSANDGGDIRENLAYRPTPPLPDPRFRQEVPDGRREMDELKQELVEKDSRIAKLEDESKRAEAKFKDKEDWWRQRFDEESKKLVNLAAGTISSTDRIIKALVTMAPHIAWDQSHPDPVAELIKFSEDLNAWKQWQSSRIFEFLEGAVPAVAWDRSNPDPTELMITYARDLTEWKIWSSNRIFNFLDQLLPDQSFDRTLDPIEAVLTHLGQVRQTAQENFDTATSYKAAYHQEQERNTHLENQLDAALKESRQAKENLSTVQWSIEEKERLISAGDIRERNLGMQVAQLQHERNGYSRKASDLEKQVTSERAAAQANLANMRVHWETQMKEVAQQNTDLQAQISNQKEKWAREFKTQHEHYESIRKKHEDALQQADQKRKEELKLQEAHFTQELQRTSTYWDEELKRARQAHQQELKNHSVNLQTKIKSLESDLVDNSDDFRPATDDSLKTRYGSLKLLVETTTEPFNLGTVTIPQDGRFDPNNFLGREGKSQTRVLLRSIVWTKLLDGFFSSPFGFGSFGPAEGKKLLIEIYSAWRKLFGDGPLPGKCQVQISKYFNEVSVSILLTR